MKYNQAVQSLQYKQYDEIQSSSTIASVQTVRFDSEQTNYIHIQIIFGTDNIQHNNYNINQYHRQYTAYQLQHKSIRASIYSITTTT